MPLTSAPLGAAPKRERGTPRRLAPRREVRPLGRAHRHRPRRLPATSSPATDRPRHGGRHDGGPPGPARHPGTAAAGGTRHRRSLGEKEAPQGEALACGRESSRYGRRRGDPDRRASTPAPGGPPTRLRAAGRPGHRATGSHGASRAIGRLRESFLTGARENAGIPSGRAGRLSRAGRPDAPGTSRRSPAGPPPARCDAASPARAGATRRAACAARRPAGSGRSAARRGSR